MGVSIMGVKNIVLDLAISFLLFGACSAQIFQYFIVNNKDQTAKVIDTVKLPTCTHLDQKDNVTLRGGIKSGKFTKHGVVKDMNTCIDACCQDELCNVAFMPGTTCYTVNCYSETLCDAVPATPSHLAQGSVQISHIIRGGGNGDDVDEFRKTNGVNRNSLPNGDQCVFSRVAYNQTISGGKQAGEIIDLGKFVDIYDCAQKCCQHENCEVAQVRDHKCFAVDCFTKELCVSEPVIYATEPRAIVYMNKRNRKRQINKAHCEPSCVNGICTNNNTCTCDVGYKGLRCNEIEVIGSCDPECGIYGSCLSNDTCLCEDGWEGYKCDKKLVCAKECVHGTCINKQKNTCICEVGWSGFLCNETTSDKLVVASSGEEVLFTDSDTEPELDIKIHESPSVHETESVSALAVAICCGIAAAVLGTASVVFIARQILGRRSAVNYEYLNKPPNENVSNNYKKNEQKQKTHSKRYP
ncbi:neurogenic locus notch homolog protein 3 [Hydra vulgaris]|uniref:neurogenic locus notch homolog protein 3 n=1 Tax=Hydra vulgaris TaxID=6087 RepID=UPI00019261A6|nr:neurogenic locus notch homolog protein 3 [Hydra vulgaris]